MTYDITEDVEQISRIDHDAYEGEWYAVKLWRQNIMVMTRAELERAFRRGKAYRRHLAHEARKGRE